MTPASGAERAPAVPARGHPFAVDGLSGRAWGEVPAELARNARTWLEDAASVTEGRMSASAFCSGAWTVKVYPAPSVFGWGRRPRALRSALGHFECLPVPSPRPLVALARSARGPSLLVREFVPGRTLAELWRDPRASDEAGERALPAFLADLRALPRQHGDLHPGNLLWTGTRWVLLDVDGLRHRFHPRARVLRGQWSCLARGLADEARLERVFHATLALARGRDATRWEDVQRALARRPRIRSAAESRVETRAPGPK